MCGATIYLTWRVAVGRRLTRAECTPETDRAIRRRIEVAQSLYFLGALIGLAHTLAGVAFIIAVQLNYAVAPLRAWGRRAAGG